jgi:hypothetical protein
MMFALFHGLSRILANIQRQALTCIHGVRREVPRLIDRQSASRCHLLRPIPTITGVLETPTGVHG